MNDVVDVWRRLVIAEGVSWALFSHGTCVVVADPTAAPAQDAIDLLGEWGPVAAGTPSADFSVVQLDGLPGWVVTSHLASIHTYVSPDELDEDPSELDIGLLGRYKRDRDAIELVVVHVEDHQSRGAPA